MNPLDTVSQSIFEDMLKVLVVGLILGLIVGIPAGGIITYFLLV